MTFAEMYFICALAVEYGALIFWTRGNGGDLQPLLLPVNPSVWAVN